MQSSFLATLVLSVSLCALVPQTPSLARPFDRPCLNLIEREPVVLYEVTGGTLTGPVDSFLAVYSDGSSRLSSYLGGTGTGSSQFTVLDALEVESLRQALLDAGAFAMCDQQDFTSDSPLQTLTLFRPGSRRANTFSWITSDGLLQPIQALLEAFVAAHFQPLGGQNG